MSPECSSLSFATAPGTSSLISVELFQSAESSVVDTQYFGMLLNLSAKPISSVRSGQAAAKPSYVMRPSSRASAPITSSSLNLSPSSPRANLNAQPPWRVPSDPPGSSTTPSTLMNCETTILPIGTPVRLLAGEDEPHESNSSGRLHGMSFLQPAAPPFDLDEWKAKPYLERIKANCQDWAVNGFGPPEVIYLLYAIKLVVYLGGAFLLMGATTPGLGGLGSIGDWWTNPIVFQKLAVWTLLWEIVGIGPGSMQLAARYGPILGGALYWLRPGMVRLPPWPDKVPFTRGTRRTLVDVALYVGVLGVGV